jgi:type I restriction enzyme S subunit
MLGEKLPRACVVPHYVGPAIVKADCVRLRVHRGLSTPSYVTHALNSPQVREGAMSLVHGVGRPRLGLKWLRTLPMPVAPRPEQHRIVEAIESYFTRLDDAEATLERVQRNLKRYRASVLQAAVEGRLVPTEAELARAEGRDYEPASVLLERILAERRRRWEEAEMAKTKARGRAPKDDRWRAKYPAPLPPDVAQLPDLPDGWCWASIDQLAHLVRNGYSKKPSANGNVRILRISAVRPMSVDFDDARWLPGSSDDYLRDLVEPGDLLFTRYNGSPALVGVSGLVRAVDQPTVHPDKLIKVRLIEHCVEPGYLELATNTGASRSFIEGRTRTTAGQAGISGGDIKQVPVPLAPLAEQRRISREVGALLSLADDAGKALRVNTLRCARLRQSILKWAFEGRLVDQDPTDEPALRLLERIKGEREAEGGKPGSGKRARRQRGRGEPAA